MAITKTQQIDPAEHAPFNACTCTTNVAVGDLIVAWVEFGAVLPDSNVTNLTVSDNVNSGLYTRLGQQVFGDNTEVTTLFYKVANTAGKPTLTTSTISNTYTGKISCTTFTGFTGIPTLDFNLGLQKTTQASGNTSADVYIGQTTSFANSIGLCQIFISGTFFQPVPTNWSFGQSQFYIYKIAAAASTSLEVNGTYNGTNTGSGSMFMLADLYDFPGSGDDLHAASNTDLVTYNSNFTYSLESATGYIEVGPNGAFCNNQAGTNSVNATWGGAFTADQQAEVTLVSFVTGAQAGVGVRFTNGAVGPNGYVLYCGSAGYSVGRLNNGILTSLTGSVARTNVAGDVFNLTVKGSTLTVTANGITQKTLTDTTWTQGAPALCFAGVHPSTVVSTFRAGSLGILVPSYQVSTVVGQIGGQVKPAITQQTVTTSVSSTPFAANLADALTGQTATFIEGQLVNVLSITGQSATFTEGSLTFTITSGASLTFGAQSAGFTVGQLLDGISYVLDQGATTINLFSQTATFTEGTIPYAVNPLLTASSSPGTIGIPTVTMTLVSATAQSASFIEGIINPSQGSNLTAGLSALNLASSEGVLTLTVGYTPSAFTGTFVVGTILFSNTGDFTLQLAGQAAAFTLGSFSLVLPVGYPNLAGLILEEATDHLQLVGAIVPASIGYFGTWPVSVTWVPSQSPPFVVLGQSIPPTSPIVANQPITLTVSQPAENVAYP